MSWKKKICQLIYINLKSENLDSSLCDISNRSHSSLENQISTVDSMSLSNVTTFSQGRWFSKVRVGAVCFISSGQGEQTAASLVSFADTVVCKYPCILSMPYSALC